MILGLVLSLLLSISHASERSCQEVLISSDAIKIHAALSKEMKAVITELAGLRIEIDVARLKNKNFFIDQMEEELQKKQAQIVQAFLDLNIMSEYAFSYILSVEISRIQNEMPISSEQSQLQRDTLEYYNSFDGTRAIFHRIEPGSFLMGDPKKPEEQVTVEITRPFEMMATVTTQLIWRTVTELAQSRFGDKYKLKVDPSRFKGPLLPVESVNYPLVQEWISALNELSKAGEPALENLIQGHKQGDVYMLPTQAQWEFVVRGRGLYMGTYHFGDDKAELEKYAWSKENSEGKTHPVAEKLPLEFDGKKFYDMHGNVYEWVLDPYENKLRGGKDPQGVVDPADTRRIVRGGCWAYDASFSTSSSSLGVQPNNDLFQSGVRLVRLVQ